MKLTTQDIEQILHLIDASPFDHLKLDSKDFKLEVSRGGLVSTEVGNGLVNNAEDQAPTQQRVSGPNSDQVGEPEKVSQENAKVVDLCAPMLGTFYSRPKPGADPFVTVGSKLAPDTTIGIIEVMKLMNSIPAQMSGEVVEICVSDGGFVEYGQVLMRVRSS
ncbi:MAG: acetyl-CoA carboxylase, biotin carboxyl carrier protein [Pusillimonas sp.]|jgi:acetyl-CoA carboxylase biotin carboxyl carrier protein|nr:acetyl-CoA carboxylase, biotin carboxyl carrier protein [Pusillimonas sp.]